MATAIPSAATTTTASPTPAPTVPPPATAVPLATAAPLAIPHGALAWQAALDASGSDLALPPTTAGDATATTVTPRAGAVDLRVLHAGGSATARFKQSQSRTPGAFVGELDLQVAPSSDMSIYWYFRLNATGINYHLRISTRDERLYAEYREGDANRPFTGAVPIPDLQSGRVIPIAVVADEPTYTVYVDGAKVLEFTDDRLNGATSIFDLGVTGLQGLASVTGFRLYGPAVAAAPNPTAAPTPRAVGQRVFPRGVAVNTTTQRVYVTGTTCIVAPCGGALLFVLDGATNSLLATVPTAASASAVAVNPRTNRVYLAQSDGISVIDGATNTVIATVAVPYPISLAVNAATNRIYAAGFKTVAVLDGATNQVVATVGFGSLVTQIMGIAVNEVANRAYVAALGPFNVFSGEGTPGSLSVIDGANRVVSTVPLTLPGDHVAVDSGANRVYVSCYFGYPDGRKDSNIAVLDATSSQVLAVLPVDVVGTGGIAVVPATHRVVVASSGNPLGAGGYKVLDGNSNQVVASGAVGRGPEDVAANVTTSRVYVTNFYSGTVSVIAADTGLIATTITLVAP